MPEITSSLKPFVINSTDIQFLIDQVNFVPLFDATGNIIVAWDGTGTVYNFAGVAYADQHSAAANLAKWGQSYQSFTDLAGTRDVSGYWNNLAPLLAHYGDTGQIFPRMIAADYTHYLQQATEAGTPSARPTDADLTGAPITMDMVMYFTDGLVTVNTYNNGLFDYTINTWDRTNTTVDTATQIVDGHHIFASLSQTTTTTTTQTDLMFRDAAGEHVGAAGIASTSDPVTGPVTISGGELDGQYHSFTTAYALDHQDYTVQGALGGGAEGDTTATDGTAINIKNVVDYTPRMISLTTTTAGVTYDSWANHQTMDDGVGGTIVNPDAANHTMNEIYYSPTTGEAVVLDWGVLETVANGGEGQVDTQARLEGSAGQDDHFIGGLNPGVSPSNGFFVLFGQFFDHGLDFIDKGQLDSAGKNITIKIALAVDDPLYGMIGSDGQPVTSITINRATVQTVDADGSSQYVNHVSPFIDQSQTYGSDVQRTELLREWVSTDGSTYHAGMNLFDGHTLATQWAKADGTLTNETLPTLNELRDHIAATGRDAITWEDIGNLRNRDAGGHVVTGASGEALLLDMNPRFDTTHLLTANGESTLETGKVTDAIATLNDDLAIYGPGVTLAMVNDVLTLTGLPGTSGPLTGASALYPWVDFSNFGIMQNHAFAGPISDLVHSAVGDILMASVGDHYIAGDGRANENFGLTSIHHVFHEEHNFQVQNLIDALHRQDVSNPDDGHARLHEFQVDTGTTNAAGDFTYGVGGAIAWNEEKVFQGAKLIVEMEYQHAAVDQYARNVSPNIQEFVGYSPDKQPDTTLEYSQVAFRFGHSTLRETIDTIDPTHGLTGKIMGYALHDAFLNPELFGATGPGAIILGMTHQQQNEVDEFVTPALNQGLLGQPLDLAAINIARGRDVGIPTFNDFRAAIGLDRYTSWNDFGQNMQHPSSLVNFIAAYAFDGSMDKAQAVFDLAGNAYADNAAAEALGAVLGWTGGVASFVSQAIAFLSGDEGVGGLGTMGFNNIDTWLGGLAEIHQPGGLLGETFDKVFVTQIESLMDGDRFYYLYRLAGQQFGEEVANGQLKDIFERNTGLTHLNGNIFGYADQYVDLGAQKEVVGPGEEAQTTGNEHKYGDNTDVAAGITGIYSNGGLTNANDGNVITINGHTYIQDTRLSADNPLSADYDATGQSAFAQNGFTNLDGTPNSGAESSEVIVGSQGNDLIYSQGGDDTDYGEEGDDILYGGYGIDRLYGGQGGDTMYGGDNPDLMDGGAGDDKLFGDSSGSDINGADQIIGGFGNDTIYGGTGIDKLSAGAGDDRVYGDQDTDPFTHGGDGDDYVDGGSGGDILYGDNGDDVVVGGSDQDQLFGGDGDDILRPGDPTGALTVGSDEVLGGDGIDVNDKGFDLVDFSDNNARPHGITFDIGNQSNPNVTVNGAPIQVPSYQIDGAVGSVSDDSLVGDDASAAGNGSDATIAGNNWLVGGSGNDTFQGLGGNDIIVGGSIRLDALIGKYNSGYDHNMGNAGLTEAEQLQDAQYQGASHRVDYAETIDDSGLLGHATTMMFEKHFTEMLRAEQFKDTVLGDGGTDGTADTAIYTGNMFLDGAAGSDYTIVALDAHGAVVANPHDGFFALKITDNRTDADFIDANGQPLLDANGNPLTNEGTDLVIGIENLKFANQTLNVGAFFDKAPTLDLNYAPTARFAQDQFGSSNNAYGQNNGNSNWNGGWVETNDTFSNSGGSTSGQIIRSSSSNGVLQFGQGNGAEITRGVGSTGATPTSIVFDLQAKNGIGAGETLALQYSSDGLTFTTLATYGSADPTGTKTISLAGQTMTANSEIRFAVSTLGGSTDYFRVDNVRVNYTADTNGSGNTATYTERSGAGAALTTAPHIVDPDDTSLMSAKIVLSDAIAGDRLNVGTMPAGITATLSADLHTVTLTGSASLTAYESALKLITYTNPTNHNPTVFNTDTTRHIDVTVNDGFRDSAVATTVVSITAINEATVTGADHIITNTLSFVLPDSVLLANDTDPDSTLSISGTNTVVGLTSASHSNSAQSISVTDNGTPGGTFNYVVNGVNGAVNIVRQTGTTLTGSAANEILIGGATNDSINAGDGSDTIMWNVGGTVTRNFNGSYTTNVTTGGHDVIDGGAGNDTFVLTSTVTGSGQGNTNTNLANGRPDVSETFDIYTHDAAVSAGIAGIAATSEIVITRNGVVAAELTHVEELVINTGAGGDTVAVHGNFDPTHLNYNTIHVNGGKGNNTVDITDLTSAHRIVFDSHGAGHVIGDLRPQDVVDGFSVGVSTGQPVDDDPVTPPPAMNTILADGSGDGQWLDGTAQADYIQGGVANDIIQGRAGADLIRAGDGDDAVRGGGGADTIEGGLGNDALFGDRGDDTFLTHGHVGGDLIFGGAGSDTLDLADVFTSAEVDLGSLSAMGTVVIGTEVGRLVSVENVVGGFGSDHIIASTAVNHLTGGAGDDIFSFLTAQAANGDEIMDLAPGDKIDLAGIDADTTTTGLQGFTLATAGQSAAAGLLELVDMGDGVTLINGHTDGDGVADFTITVHGNTPLGFGNFTL
ncbi:MAG: peroxidase family protein [bacterium]